MIIKIYDRILDGFVLTKVEISLTAEDWTQLRAKNGTQLRAEAFMKGSKAWGYVEDFAFSTEGMMYCLNIYSCHNGLSCEECHDNRGNTQ